MKHSKKKIKTPAKFKWVLQVEISVDPRWVADGYYPDKERIASELMLSHAYTSEMQIKSKRISGPSKRTIDNWLNDSEV